MQECEESGLDNLYPRWKYASFPDAILALQHVLTYIDELLMTPEEAVILAARNGQAEWMRKLLPRIHGGIEVVACKLLEIGASNGDCNVIEVVHTWRARVYRFRLNRHCRAMEFAICGGHLEAVKCLLSKFWWKLTEVLDQALKAKQQDIVKLLCQEASVNEFNWAAEKGHLLVIQMMHSRVGSVLIYYALNIAASRGYSHIIKFLFVKHGWSQFGILDVSSYGSPIRLAAARGHLNIVKFLVDNGGFVDRIELDYAFEASVVHGHLKIAEVLYDKAVVNPSMLNEAFLNAASSGNLDITKWFFKIGATRPRLVEDALLRVVSRGHTKVFKFLLNHGADRTFLDNMFLKAATNGNIKTLQFLHSNDGINRARLLRDAFVQAAAAGCSEVVKFLFDNGVTQKVVLNDAFVQAAAAGKLENVKFLFGSGVTDSAILDDAFLKAAVGGHLQVVTFLHSKGVNQTPLLEHAFLRAATHGKLSMVKFLHHNGVRNTIVLDESLEKAASEGHVKIVKFLCLTQTTEFSA